MCWLLTLAALAAGLPTPDPEVRLDPPGAWMAWMEEVDSPGDERVFRACVAPVSAAPARCTEVGPVTVARDPFGWLGPGTLALHHDDRWWRHTLADGVVAPISGEVRVRDDGRAFRLERRGGGGAVSDWHAGGWRALGEVHGGTRRDWVVPLVEQDRVIGTLIRRLGADDEVWRTMVTNARGRVVLDSLQLEDIEPDEVCRWRARMPRLSTLPHGGGVYAWNGLDHDHTALEWVDLRRGRSAVVLAPEQGVAGPIAQRADGSLLGLAASRERLTWARVEDAGLARLLELVGPGVRVRQATEGGPWVVRVDDGSPPTSHLFEPTTGRLTRALAWPEPDQHPLLHSTWHEARDGMPLATYVLQPDPAVHGPPPYHTVVYVHGGPWARIGGRFHPLVHHFALQGYAVVATDFRGSLGYGADHCEAWRGELSTGMVEDVVDGLDHAHRLGLAQRPALVFGWSYGGLVASILATQHPDAIVGAVAVAGPSGGLADGSRQWHALSEARDMRATPRRHLDTLTRPLLQIHGADDEVVDVGATENAARTAARHGAPLYAAVRVPGLDHSGDATQQERVLALADHWFARCLDRSEGPAPGVDAVDVLVDGPGWLGAGR